MEEWLEKLACKMVCDTRDDDLGIIQAGYTYLGQMISHDIVPPAPTSRHPRNVLRFLNLDSIYGDLSDHGRWQEEHGNFLPGASKFDLPRNDRNVAQIPEPRNDDNIIIAQMHVLWQRIHQAVNSFGGGGTTLSARKLVVLLFQLVVVEDFLKQLLDRRVFDACFIQGKKYLGLPSSKIPEEFSLAGFRFGHSMVRADYKLNSRVQEVPLEDLLKPNEPIKPEHEIVWTHFFSGNDSQGVPAQLANRINTHISDPMQKIPGVRPGEGPTNIAQANLIAGKNAGLKPGNLLALEILQKIPDEHRLERREPPPTLGLVPLGNDKTTALGVNTNDLPLWPYLLLEAEVHHLGLHLGVLGSMIVAETLWDAISGADSSIIQGGIYDFDSVMARLEELGTELLGIAGNHASQDRFGRRLAMHHLIHFVEIKENTP